jgi:hypothetical protein
MGWMDLIAGALSVGSGGIVGILGSALGAFVKNKERAAKAIEQAAEREFQKDLLVLKMSSDSNLASWDAMNVTHQSEVALNGQPNYKWVVAAKTLFRPVLTLTLWGLVIVQLNMILDGTLTEYALIASDTQAIFSTTEIVELVRYVLYSTVFAASTATMWWFGERAMAMPEQKNR